MNTKICAAALCLLLVPASLRASPILITITSGFAETIPHHGQEYALYGKKFSMTGGLGFGNIQPGSGNYAPGTILDVFGYWNDSDVSAMVTFEDDTFQVHPLLYGNINMRFAGGSITLPALVDTDTITLETPFTFSGNVRDTLSPRDEYLIDALLFGQGTASVTFGGVNGAFWYPQLVHYEFEKHPDTVPEPTSLLLLGVGLAGLAARMRRRVTTPLLARSLRRSL